MATLLTSFQSLIITVKKNAWSSILTTLLLMLLIVTWSARENIASFIEHNPSSNQEKNRFDKSVVVDGQINDILNVVRSQTNGDRVFIRQFHNSKTDLTGLPFSSVSTTYYALSAGIAQSPDSLASYPLSSINEQLSAMFVGNSPKCAVLDINDVSNTGYLEYLKNNGEQIIYTCPLINLKGEPVGYIGVAYLTREKMRPSDDSVERILNDTGIRIVGYLTRITEHEKKSWYSTILKLKE